MNWKEFELSRKPDVGGRKIEISEPGNELAYLIAAPYERAADGHPELMKGRLGGMESFYKIHPDLKPRVIGHTKIGEHEVPLFDPMIGFEFIDIEMKERRN